MIEGDGGVLDNDATLEEDMFHDQGSAVIMKAHSTCGVYADCHIQVLEKESRALQRGRRRAGAVQKNRDSAIHIERSDCLPLGRFGTDP